MVESELRFLEVEVERVPGHPFELRQAVLGETPKGLDAVDVVAAISELVFTVTHPEVLRVSNVDQSVVANPSISVNYRVEADSSTNEPLQSSLFGVWDDLSPHPVTTFQNPEHNRLFTGSAAPFPLDPPRTKVRLVNFYRPSEWCFGFADSRQAAANLEVDVIHRSNADTGHTRRRAGRQVLSEAAENLAKLGLVYFRRSIVLVNSFHHRSIALLFWRFAS